MIFIDGLTIAGSLGSIIGGCAGVVGVIVAIKIAKRAENISKQQDERLLEERRHNTEQSCIKFLHDNAEFENLLALGYINIKYDNKRIAVRSIYNDLHLQSFYVQEYLASKYGLTDLFNDTSSIYEKCFKQVESLFAERNDVGGTMLYDNGKYWKRAIDLYAKEPVSNDYDRVEDLITEVLSGRYITYEEHVNNRMTVAFNMTSHYTKQYCIMNSELDYAKENPIAYLIEKLQIRNSLICTEKRCCEIMCIIIYWLGEYKASENERKKCENNDEIDNAANEKDKLYMSDIFFQEKVTLTMEDLFLLSLYQVYESIEKE